jgi:phage shock protein PspC (stress-responsive transcriptional regulator)
MYNRVRRVRQKDAKLAGVCAGLSKYIDPEMDPFIIRLLWLLLAIFSGFVFMTFLYFVLALVLKVEGPKEEMEEE